MRNATKVALGSIVVGCGGALATGPEPDAALLPDAKTKSDASALDVATMDAALACTGPTEVDSGGVSEETFQCCVADVQNATSDASPWGDPNGPDASLVANDPAAENCCKAIVARIDDEPDGGNLGTDYGTASQGSVLQWCCMALGNPMGPACTPWGPPTPPAMEVA